MPISKATLEKWYREQLRPIKSFLFGAVGIKSQDTVDDLAQEVFMRLQRYGDEDVIRDPQAFLMHLARNVANEWRARHVNKKAHFSQFNVGYDSEETLGIEDVLPADESQQLEVAEERDDFSQAVVAAFGKLTPRQQTLLKAHVYDNLTYVQIAETSGQTHRVVLRDLTKAYSKLRLLAGDNRDFLGMIVTWRNRLPEPTRTHRAPKSKWRPWVGLGPKTEEEARAMCRRLSTEDVAKHYKMPKRQLLDRLHEFGITGHEANRLHRARLRIVERGERLTPEQWKQMRDSHDYLTPEQTAAALGVHPRDLAYWRRYEMDAAYDLPYEELRKTAGRGPSVRYKSEVVQKYLDRIEEYDDGHTVRRRLRVGGRKTCREKILAHLEDGAWYRASEMLPHMGANAATFYELIKRLEEEGKIESRIDGYHPLFKKPIRAFRKPDYESKEISEEKTQESNLEGTDQETGGTGSPEDGC